MTIIKCKMKIGYYTGYHERREWLKEHGMNHEYFDWQEKQKEDPDNWYDCFRFNKSECATMFALVWS